MMIYNYNGAALNSAYTLSGTGLNQAYNIVGIKVFQSGASWLDEVTIEKLYNSSASTYYYVVTIPQTRTNGEKQYPFVFVPNGASGGTMSTLTMVQTYGFYMGMNAGYFDAFQTGSRSPYGITIENGVLIEEDSSYFTSNYTMTIDEDGQLGYAGTMDSGVTAQSVLNDGAISAILGLVPLVVNGVASGVESTWWSSTERAQRQIIGQYSNGDYCVITAEGRSYDSSSGFTVTEAQNLCLNMGLQFAMMLDGGGSTETVIDGEQLNTVYEGTTGRIVPTYIVFNGTDTFSVPNA